MSLRVVIFRKKSGYSLTLRMICQQIIVHGLWGNHKYNLDLCVAVSHNIVKQFGTNLEFKYIVAGNKELDNGTMWSL